MPAPGRSWARSPSRSSGVDRHTSCGSAAGRARRADHRGRAVVLHLLRQRRRQRRRRAQRRVRRPAARRGRHRAPVRAPGRTFGGRGARRTRAVAGAQPGRPCASRASFSPTPRGPSATCSSGLDLEVEAGETVALVGPSGAGKTSVLQLLMRFYDPTAGRILFDGQPITALDPRAYRARIGLVPQEPVIFSADAATNIRYGRPDASEVEVRAAAEAAAATEFLDRLPDGFATFLGEKGVQALGRPAAADRDRACYPARPRRAAARRGDERLGRGERAPGAAGA